MHMKVPITITINFPSSFCLMGFWFVWHLASNQEYVFACYVCLSFYFSNILSYLVGIKFYFVSLSNLKCLVSYRGWDNPIHI